MLEWVVTTFVFESFVTTFVLESIFTTFVFGPGQLRNLNGGAEGRGEKPQMRPSGEVGGSSESLSADRSPVIPLL